MNYNVAYVAPGTRAVTGGSLRTYETKDTGNPNPFFRTDHSLPYETLEDAIAAARSMPRTKAGRDHTMHLGIVDGGGRFALAQATDKNETGHAWSAYVPRASALLGI